MKILKQLGLLTIAMSLFIQSCSAIPKSNTTQLDLPTLIPYRDGKLWGYCDKDKKIKIKLEYARVSLFNEMGLAQVYKPNIYTGNENNDMSEFLTGVIDSLGNEIIPIKYPNYHHSFLLVHYDGKNKEKFGPFDAVVYGDFQIVIINQNLENLQANLNVVFPEMPNMQIVSIKNEYKDDIVYNRNGNSILPDSFKIPYRILNTRKIDFSSNIFFAEHKTKNFTQVFDTMGNLLNDKKFKEVTRLNDTLYIGIDFATGQYGLYHNSGEVFFENLKYITPYFERENKEMGLIALYTPNDVVLYSLKLKKHIIQPTNYSKFSTNRSQVENKNIVYHNNMLLINYGKDKSEFGLFSNETGEMIVKGYPQMNVDFSFQLIMAKNNKTVHLYDFNANLLNEFQDVDTVIPISQKHFLVSRNRKVGVWSQQTKTYIVDIAFENIDFSLPDVFLAQNTDKKIAVYDTLGKMVFPQQFDKHSVFIEERVDGCWSNFRNVNNEEGFDITPVRVFSGSATSFQYSFAQERQERFLRHEFIRNFYNKDYDRILKELKKELITVILEDSLGNRYRLMPDYKLKDLPKDADFVYRVLDVYFYGKGKSKLEFYIDGKDTKHNAYSMEVKYYLNQPFVIIGIGNNIFPNEFYAFDPVTNTRSEINFKSLEFKFDNDSFYYYGLSGNHNYLLSGNLQTNLKTIKNQNQSFGTNDYDVVFVGIGKNPDFKGGYGVLNLVNKKGQILFKNYCDITPTNYNHLLGLVYCTEDEHIFVGYGDIYGNKYFKN